MTTMEQRGLTTFSINGRKGRDLIVDFDRLRNIFKEFGSKTRGFVNVQRIIR